MHIYICKQQAREFILLEMHGKGNDISYSKLQIEKGLELEKLSFVNSHVVMGQKSSVLLSLVGEEMGFFF